MVPSINLSEIPRVKERRYYSIIYNSSLSRRKESRKNELSTCLNVRKMADGKKADYWFIQARCVMGVRQRSGVGGVM